VALPPVLVVIGDATIRRVVGWIVEEMDLFATLTASWRQAVVSTVGRPGCIVADLDDWMLAEPFDHFAGVFVFCVRPSLEGSKKASFPLASNLLDFSKEPRRCGTVIG
jgi:hypothetical protein